MDDQSVTTDEARRVAQHDAIKSHVQRDVNADIEQRTAHAAPAEKPELERVAGDLRGRAIVEVAGRERDVSRSRGLARGSQVVDYVFYLVYTLLGIRLVLSLIAARSGNGFVRFIETVSDPFYAIFRGIVPSPSAEGGYTLAVPILIAIVAYVVLHVAINGFLRMIATRKTEI